MNLRMIQNDVSLTFYIVLRKWNSDFGRGFWHKRSNMFHNIKRSRNKRMESIESRRKLDFIATSHIVGVIAMHKCSHTTMMFYLIGKMFSFETNLCFVNYTICARRGWKADTEWTSCLKQINFSLKMYCSRCREIYCRLPNSKVFGGIRIFRKNELKSNTAVRLCSSASTAADPNKRPENDKKVAVKSEPKPETFIPSVSNVLRDNLPAKPTVPIESKSVVKGLFCNRLDMVFYQKFCDYTRLNNLPHFRVYWTIQNLPTLMNYCK